MKCNFFILGIMVSLEQSEANVKITEDMVNKQQIDLIVKLLKEQKTHLQDKPQLEVQMKKIIELLEKDSSIPKVYGKMNLEMAMVQQNMINVFIGVFKDELKRREQIFWINLAKTRSRLGRNRWRSEIIYAKGEF